MKQMPYDVIIALGICELMQEFMARWPNTPSLGNKGHGKSA